MEGIITSSKVRVIRPLAVTKTNGNIIPFSSTSMLLLDTGNPVSSVILVTNSSVGVGRSYVPSYPNFTSPIFATDTTFVYPIDCTIKSIAAIVFVTTASPGIMGTLVVQVYKETDTPNVFSPTVVMVQTPVVAPTAGTIYRMKQDGFSLKLVAGSRYAYVARLIDSPGSTLTIRVAGGLLME